MAEYNSFTYDEIKSSDFGVYIGGEKTFDAPSLRGQSIEIPGRNGNVFISSDSYENVELVYPSFNFEPDLETFRSKLAKLRNALSSRASYKRLTDTLHPDEFRMAVFRDGFEVKPIKYNTAAEFDIVFDCKPQRFLKSGEIPVEYTPGQTPSDEQTKTGSIVTFEAEEGTIISDIKADINPVQDLHGYDKPWAGGNGKNKLNCRVSRLKTLNTGGSWNGNTYTFRGVTFTLQSADGDVVDAIVANGTASGGTGYLIVGLTTDWSMQEGSTYILSNGANTGTAGFYNGSSSSNNNLSIQFTYSGWTNSSNVTIGIANGATANAVVFKPMIRLASVTDATFEPYSNICPISGWDSVKIANMSDITNRQYFNGLLDGTYGFVDLGTLDWIYVPDWNGHPAHTVVFSTAKGWGDNVVGNFICPKYTSMSRNQLYALDGSGMAISPSKNLAVRDYTYTSASDFKTAMSGVYLVYELATPTTPTITKAQFDMLIEAFGIGGQLYIIDLNGTRYGCTLDVTSGVLKVCPYYASYNGETLTGEWVSDRDEYSPNTSPTIGAQVVNIGGSLITVQLTPTEVKALRGVNNVWADSGDITVKYGTNPYIIVNPTDFPSKPLLEVTGVGSFWLGDTQITITGTSGQIIYIDCETGECYKVTGGIISPANGLVTLNRLDFPKLASGINNIQLGSGISKVKITPRWWRL